MWKLSIVLVLAATLAGCQKSPVDTPVHGSLEPRQKITVAYTTQPQSTLIHVAVAKGFFAEEGLDVESALYSFGKESLQSLIEHKADFAAVAETPFMFNVLKGEKIFVIANIEASTNNNAVVARKDTGIATGADLKGQRVGFTPGTTSDFFLDALLTANGLTRSEIQSVAMKPDAMADALMAKAIDAVSTWNYPLTKIKRQLGANATALFDREIYTETYNIVAQQAYVGKNPETVKHFLRALIKAESFVANNVDQAQSIVSLSTKTDKDLVREVWSVFDYRVVLDQRLLVTLEDETRWAIKNKMTDQTAMPVYENFIYSDALRAVMPEAVRLNR